MPARGPLPKDPRRRQRQGGPKTTAIAPYVWANKPEAHRGWLKVTKIAWDELWGQPIAAAYLPSDVAALARLYDLKDERERCVRAIRRGTEVVVVEAGQTRAKRIPAILAQGSTTNTVIHPLVKWRAELDGEILALEDRFGLSLQSRLRMGVDMNRLAKSMQELTDAFDADEDEEPEEDPRLALVEFTDPHPRREAAT